MEFLQLVTLKTTQSKSSEFLKIPSHWLFCKNNPINFGEWTVLDNSEKVPEYFQYFTTCNSL